MLLAAALAAFSACSELVRYTDELTDERTGRSLFVTTPATFGGAVGFVLGVPVDLVVLPVTWGVYRYQVAEDPLGADPLSTMLFPSFVLWRVGKLVGMPFDLVEFVVWRAWRSEATLTRQEREEIEYAHDEDTLPTYPVEPIYPTAEWLEQARRER
jgi:hypothetical protein